MKMNLAQMQVIQRTLELFSSTGVTEYLPVVEYNGRVLTADFYDKEFIDFNNKYYDFIDPDIVNNRTIESPVKTGTLNSDFAAVEAEGYVLNRQYKDITQNKNLYLIFLENVAYKFDRGSIPTKLLTNVQYLDNSISHEVDVLRLDDKPEFEFISLVSKN